MDIKKLLLKNKISRNLLFFVFHKKLNKKRYAKKIQSFKLNSEKEKTKLIVSLTSFPARINEVPFTIYSLLNQTKLPQKIILWLAESQFPKKEKELPELLLKLVNEVFEIKWCDDLRSYKKLIPLVQSKCQLPVLICDDDIYYRKNTVELLWNCHLKNTDDVICHIGKKLTFGAKKRTNPYSEWEWIKTCSNSRDVMPVGGGTVLYPASVYNNSELLNKIELFKQLAPDADDIWFWYSITKAGYKVSIPEITNKSMIFINPEREYGITDEFTLTKVNEGEDMNDKQIKNIEDFFNESFYNMINR